MSAGVWNNNDNLTLFYGTQKAVSEQGGDFLSYGDTREIEVLIPDMTKLTTLPLIQSFTTFFPEVNGTQYILIEEVSMVTEVAATGSGAVLSVGLGYPTAGGSTLPLPVTAIDNAAFITAFPVTSFATLGTKNIWTVGTTYGGDYIGNAITLPATTHKSYITALYTTAAFTVGAVRIRIRYRTYNVISQ